MSVSNQNPQPDQPLEVWRTLVEVWDREADRFWARNNVFLLLNGGLLAVLTALARSTLVVIAISCLALFILGVWYRINRVGKHYLDRWLDPIATAEASLSLQPFAAMRQGTRSMSRARKATGYMNLVIGGLALAWSVLLIATAIEPSLVVGHTSSRPAAWSAARCERTAAHVTHVTHVTFGWRLASDGIHTRGTLRSAWRCEVAPSKQRSRSSHRLAERRLAAGGSAP